MIDALIQGKLHTKAQERTSKSGQPFITAKVKTSTRTGDVAWIDVIAFGQEVQRALLALEPGDAVALAGELEPRLWTPKDGSAPRAGLSLLAHAVTTAYHVTRKRQAVKQDHRPKDEAWRAGAPADRF